MGNSKKADDERRRIANQLRGVLPPAINFEGEETLTWCASVARVFVEGIVCEIPSAELLSQYEAERRREASAAVASGHLSEAGAGVLLRRDFEFQRRLHEKRSEYRRAWKRAGMSEGLLRLWFYVALDCGLLLQARIACGGGPHAAGEPSTVSALDPAPQYRSLGYYRALRRLLARRGVDLIDLLERRIVPSLIDERRGKTKPEKELTENELFGVREVLQLTAAIRSLQRSAGKPSVERNTLASEAFLREANLLGNPLRGVTLPVDELDRSIKRDRKRHSRVNPRRIAINETNRWGFGLPEDPVNWRALETRFRDQLRRRRNPPQKTG